MNVLRRIHRAGRPAPAAALPLLAWVAMAGCGTLEPEDRFVFNFDFRQEDHGFEADFTDYPVGREEDVEFVADHRPLPPPLDDQGSALFHSGANISDDLFMYFKRRVEGLDPGTAYRATFTLEFASDIGQECTVGVGANVHLKAGASRVEPVGVVQDGDVRLNVDKGEQANRGEAALLLGDMRNGEPGCGEEVPFALQSRESGGENVVVTADDQGRAWLFFGSESAFESPHELFFASLRVVMRPE